MMKREISFDDLCERLDRMEQILLNLTKGMQSTQGYVPSGQRGEFQRVAAMSREERKAYNKMNKQLHKAA